MFIRICIFHLSIYPDARIQLPESAFQFPTTSFERCFMSLRRGKGLHQDLREGLCEGLAKVLRRELTLCIPTSLHEEEMYIIVNVLYIYIYIITFIYIYIYMCIYICINKKPIYSMSIYQRRIKYLYIYTNIN